MRYLIFFTSAACLVASGLIWLQVAHLANKEPVEVVTQQVDVTTQQVEVTKEVVEVTTEQVEVVTEQVDLEPVVTELKQLRERMDEAHRELWDMMTGCTVENG